MSTWGKITKQARKVNVTLSFTLFLSDHAMRSEKHKTCYQSIWRQIKKHGFLTIFLLLCTSIIALLFLIYCTNKFCDFWFWIKNYGTSIAAFLAAFSAVWIAAWNNHNSRKERIAIMRQEWINELRKDGAKMIHYLNCLFDHRCPDPNPHPGDSALRMTDDELKKETIRYDELYARIELRLNVHEKPEDKTLEKRFLSNIEKAKSIACVGAQLKKKHPECYKKLYGDMVMKKFDEEMSALLHNLGKILKIEWERVKKGG